MEVVFKVAHLSDLAVLLTLADEFNREDHHPYNEGITRNGLISLLNDETAGRVWLIWADAEVVGYLVLTLGFRLAYGRYAFIDELYVRPSHRGQGIGRQAIAFAEEMCRGLEVKALHLEVERENNKARALYTSVGFVDYSRYLMTCWLAGEPNQHTIKLPQITFTPAQSSDIDTLFSLRQETGSAGHAAEAGSRARLGRLVTDSSLGRVWLIRIEDQPVGYIALTFSYSLEFHGRDALLDELYLPDPHRQDFAAESLKFALAECQSLGVNAVHVEMERANTPGQTLYRAAGFADDNSYLMTKWIE